MGCCYEVVGGTTIQKKLRLRGIKAKNYWFFFCIESQVTWLSASWDLLGYNLLEILTCRSPAYLLRLPHSLGKSIYALAYFSKMIGILKGIWVFFITSCYMLGCNPLKNWSKTSLCMILGSFCVIHFILSMYPIIWPHYLQLTDSQEASLWKSTGMSYY